MCVPDFFLGVVSIYFWLSTALGLLSDPRLAGHPLQKDRENQVPRGSAAFLGGMGESPETLEFGHL